MSSSNEKTPNQTTPTSNSAKNPSTPTANTSSANKVLCYCKKPALIYQVKKEGPNKGRWFYKCYNSISNYIEGTGTTCRFYKWKEELESVPVKPPTAFAGPANTSGSMTNDPLTPPPDNKQQHGQIHNYHFPNQQEFPRYQQPEHWNHQTENPHHRLTEEYHRQAGYSLHQEQQFQDTRREEEFWTSAPEGPVNNNLFTHIYGNSSITVNDLVPPSPSPPLPDHLLINSLKEKLEREERRAYAFQKSAQIKAEALASTKEKLASMGNENEALKHRLEAMETENKSLKRKLEETELLEEENRELKRRLVVLEKGKESSSLLEEEIKILKRHNEQSTELLNDKIQFHIDQNESLKAKSEGYAEQIDHLRQQLLVTSNAAEVERLREENQLLVREKALKLGEYEFLKQDYEELKKKLEEF
ncbi:1293_t:CDS:2 [Ambispora gerdemannii]|uniref:1293_t:CDS:1 n=1 Tax=Ambispora gerdemannii TaxID=144530 RepID=A0A9N9A2K2_9GLOM|nr:1293_t:CDS:2 [Ambispora gerdemannii]